MPKTWFQFTNAAAEDTEAEVSIYDAIGYYGVTAKAFVEALKKVSGKKLTVRINSPGGVVTEGLAIFNALKRHKGGVIIQIDALAASMATYIALAGAPVRMAANAYFMIHNVSGGAFGTPKEMRRAADLAEKLQDGIVAAYVAKTGKTTAEIEEKMDEETWFDAEEAKDFGFVDEITDAFDAAACLGDEGRALLAKFRNPPAALVDSGPQQHNAPNDASKSPMKILTASLAALLATMSGKAVTETSTEAEVQAALDASIGKITALEKDKVDLTARADTADKSVTALQTEKTNLTNKLAAAEGEVTKLQGESKTTDEKARELAAMHGSAPAGKDGTSVQGNNAVKTGKELFEAYTKLDGKESADFWAKHSKELMAFGEAEEARSRRRDQD